MLRGPNGFNDVPGMLGVLRWAHEHSVYAGRLTFDDAAAQKILFHATQRHGFRSASGTWVQVAEKDGKIEGFIIGILSPVHHVHVEAGATDLFWVTTPGCSPRDRVGLMLSFTEWARHHPKCAEAAVAATDVMGGADKAARILEKIGYQKCGSIYQMFFWDKQAETL